MYGRLALGAVAVAGAFVAGHALAGTAGVAFVGGLVVMDAAWAFKLGIPQAMWYAWKHRNDPPIDLAEYEDMASDYQDIR